MLHKSLLTASTLIISLLVTAFSYGVATAQEDGSKNDASIEKLPEIAKQLDLAGENRAELEKAISKVSQKHLDGLKFLILNMPQADLQGLDSEFLLSNVRLAYRARAEAAWKIPDEIFFNDVLPYANIDEPRDPWRKKFYDLCRPIIKDCKSPAEAAQKLNETVFKEISVKYSTKRKRANQSPKESIEQGLASCTGLSIILTDACRSVGVPARLVGIPSWTNKRGNHTWVEVWDEDWHFTGAAEPSPKGLNHAWFQKDAALADPNSKRHSIYAVSFEKTETRFPIVWSPEKRVFAENVTTRYADKNKAQESGTVNVTVRAWSHDKQKRQIVFAEMVSQEDKSKSYSGKTKAGTADMNDMLTFELKPNSKYQLNISALADNGKAGKKLHQTNLETDADSKRHVEIVVDVSGDRAQVSLSDSPDEADVANVKRAADADEQKRDNDDSTKEHLGAVLTERLSGEADKYFNEKSEAVQNAMLKMQNSVRELAWERYLKSAIPAALKGDFEKNQVTFKEHLSPYTVKEVGERPENGWPLFIAMHGGGGAPARVNDSQWKHMQVYYKDQNDLTGYKYLALRAPNDKWNGFYDDYVYPLIENLIRQHIAFGDIDPNKVFIMGYSHGGYGAFAIGPKIPYRFAAIHSSAAAPTDGQTSAKTLRNTRFTFMVGEKDTRHGRRKRCEKFAAQIKELKEANQEHYPVEFMYKEGLGHGGLPDRDMISKMYEHQRDPAPKHLTWQMTDSVVKRFFWLRTATPKRGQVIDAKIEGNQITVTAEECKSFSILVDSRLIDPTKPIELKIGDSEKQIKYKPNFETLCDTISETGDLNLAFDFEIEVDLEM